MEKQPNDIPKPNKENKISLKIAKNWAKRWRKLESSYNNYNDCRAFNIPLLDLQEVIDEGATSVRAYIGVEKMMVEGEKVYVEKLMMVGVDKNGKDMISSEDGLTLDNGSGGIYDFTRPCPENCDPNSPLNGLS